MNSLRLALIGAGSVRCAPAVLAALATYFGERPIDVRLYDADEERLELFDLVARTYFAAMRSPHSIYSTIDPDEALLDVDRVVLMLDDNCALKRAKELALGDAGLGREDLLARIPPTADVLSLIGSFEGCLAIDWPGEIPDDNAVAVALECLRIARGEENPFEYLKRHERSPLREWLEGILV